jgi:hypothetical protein
VSLTSGDNAHRNAEILRDEMTAFGLNVVSEADRLLRQQIVGAVATVVAIAAIAGLTALLS